METKICIRCKRNLSVNDFHKNKNTKDGYQGYCKECRVEMRNAELGEQRKLLKRGLRMCRRCGEIKKLTEFVKNKECTLGYSYTCLACSRADWVKYRRKQSYKEYYRNYHIEYNKKNRAILSEKAVKYYQNRYYDDLNYRIRLLLKGRLNHALYGNNKNSKSKFLDILGCSIEDLKSYIEKQWKDGMSWDNWRHDGWHIDHIKPCASFDLTDYKQQKECFHYTNLRPMWARDNFLKSSIYNGVHHRKKNN